MRDKKIVTILLISFIINITNSVALKAQNKKSFGEVSKYGMAIDLQNFFSDGIPDKVLFKINNIKKRKIKGAYRLGIGARYSLIKHEVTQDNENYELTGKEKQIHFGLSFGYEKHYNLNNSVFYYGADMSAGIGFKDVLPEKAGDSEYFSASLIPFVGFKMYLSKSISLAIEAGIDNSFDYFKYTGSDVNPNNRVKNIMWHSRIKLPYSLTLNFNL